MPSSWEIQGRRVTMPVVVRDASNAVVVYPVDAARAARLLPGDAFEIVADGGQAQLVLGMVDYRDNDLGSYREIAVVLFVRPRGAAPAAAGTFIYRLPVTESFTCEAGSRIWGFPKTVEEITYDWTDGHATGTLVMDGQTVFTLRVPRGRLVPGAPEDPPMAGLTYTYVDGRPHRTRFTTGGSGTTLTPGGEGVDLTLGTHPLAATLRDLGLPATPLMSSWTEHMRGTFEAPEVL
jgi:hypothetical protein